MVNVIYPAGTLSDTSAKTCKHLLQGAPDCVFCHRDQLKQQVVQLLDALNRVRDADSVEESFRIAVEALDSVPHPKTDPAK